MNEVEKLFQEQQAESDRAPDFEKDIHSVQPMMNRDEAVNRAEEPFRPQQAVSGGSMEKQKSSVQRLLNIAIILKTLQTATEIGMYRFPKIGLSLMRSSLEPAEAAAFLRNPVFLLIPLLSFGIILLFYLLLKKQNAETTEACVPLLILTLLIPLISSLIGLPLNLLITRWVVRTQTSEALAAFSMIRSACSAVSFVSAPVVPMLAAAAGMIWCRRKYGTAQ
ncbi:MAG: hypothetical protein IKH27_04990 [Oscillospiraceae bacterium]|nr:hypothetical protein [Oscillospiraceae bacterium]